jgi:hypothetical protein
MLTLSFVVRDPKRALLIGGYRMAFGFATVRSISKG